MKLRTNLCAGQDLCSGDKAYGVVEVTKGNGFYASIRGQDNYLYFVNPYYTQINPPNQGLWVGEAVLFNTYPAGYYEHKVACVEPAI